MDTLKLWKKLNGLVKTRKPIKTAKKMLQDGRITLDEASWALAALATLPISMIDVLETPDKK